MLIVRPWRAYAAAAVAALTLTLAPATAAAAPMSAADTAADCAAFDQPVEAATNPETDATLLSPLASDLDAASNQGFTEATGPIFSAAASSGPGLVAVHRMFKSSTGDYLFTKSASEIDSAAANFGYSDQGVAFYAADRDADCLVAVTRYRKGPAHRLAATSSERDALSAAGWGAEGVAFYAGPAEAGATPAAPADPAAPAGGSSGAFSFAVLPDTQMEVVASNDPRMVNRSNWLVKQPNLKFVTQVGDLVNWDTPDHYQYAVAKTGMNVLHAAGIPYMAAIGNHDTQATGVGGAARDPSNTYTLQRDTSTFNKYFSASDFTKVGGAYEQGKVDNVYATYEAGGLKWLMLDLEFCARPGAVTWAKGVVASHPTYNVLITTHSYLNGSAGLDSSNQGYGDTSGQKLFDQLVSQYPNVKMVFSGHVGYAEKARVDTGKSGNKIYSFLTTMHETKTNPVRMMNVDPATGTLKTYIYAPNVDKTWSEYSQTVTGIDFVR